MPKVGQQMKQSLATETTLSSSPSPIRCDARLAINVDDALRLDNDTKLQLLAGRLSDRYIQVPGKRVEPAVEFSCELSEAAVVLDVLRAMDRKADRDVTRCYILQGDRWRHLPELLPLTSKPNGRTVLNPDVFDVEWEPAESQELTFDNVWGVPEKSEEIVGDQQFLDRDAWLQGSVEESLASREDAPIESSQAPVFGDGNSVGEEKSLDEWYDSVPLPNGTVTRVPRKRELPTLQSPIATTYDEHYQRWHDCQQCDLGQQRSQIVLARGTIPCDVLYVGEAPGLSEDAVGEPFVGPAGQLLDIIDRKAFVEYPKLRRAFINLVACFPREAKRVKINEPDGVEIEACAERLRECVHLCQPKLVVLVGGLPGKWWQRVCPERFYTATTIKILHPAAILRLDSLRQGLEAQRCVITVQVALRKLQAAKNGQV